jgi:hypothetical protein
VATLAICIVFVPVLLLTGAARFLFTPLAMAVVFAMLASYVLSRTLVPTMAHHMLRAELEMYAETGQGRSPQAKNVFWRLHFWVDERFNRMRASYAGLLDWALDHRRAVLGLFAVFTLGSLALLPMIGEDFFPTVDSGQMRLHVRTPSGMRIEETEAVFGAVENEIRNVIPASELQTIIDNIGMPNGGVNLAFSDNPPIGPNDGSILIALNGEDHRPTADYTVEIRGVSETGWKPLKDKVSEKYFSWDSTAFPDGEYRLRITASDAPGNPPSEALTARTESDPFIIDNTPPRITGLAAVRTGGKLEVRWHAADALNNVVRAEYSLDGGDWRVVAPATALSDSPELDYRLTLDAGPGEHTVAVRVRDDYDNEAAEKALVRP